MFKIGDIVKFTDGYIEPNNAGYPYRIIEVLEKTEECYIVEANFPIPPSLYKILRQKVTFEMIRKAKTVKKKG